MNFEKIMDIISSSKIDEEAIYDLVQEASVMDLKNEDNLRRIIKKGCTIANKEISEEQCDGLVKTILNEGISPKLFDYLK